MDAHVRHDPPCITIRFEICGVKLLPGPRPSPAQLRFGSDLRRELHCKASSHAREPQPGSPVFAEILVSPPEKDRPLKDFYQPILASVAVVPERRDPADERLILFSDAPTGSVLLRRAPPGAPTAFNTAVDLAPGGASDPLQVYPNTAAAVHADPELLQAIDPARAAMELADLATGQNAWLRPLARDARGRVLFASFGQPLPQGELQARVIDTATGRTLSRTDLKAGRWSLETPPTLRKGQTAAVRLGWKGSSWPFKPLDTFTVRLKILDPNVTFDDGTKTRELQAAAAQLQKEMNQIARIVAFQEGLAKMYAEVARQTVRSVR